MCVHLAVKTTNNKINSRCKIRKSKKQNSMCRKDTNLEGIPENETFCIKMNVLFKIYIRNKIYDTFFMFSLTNSLFSFCSWFFRFLRTIVFGPRPCLVTWWTWILRERTSQNDTQHSDIGGRERQGRMLVAGWVVSTTHIRYTSSSQRPSHSKRSTPGARILCCHCPFRFVGPFPFAIFFCVASVVEATTISCSQPLFQVDWC